MATDGIHMIETIVFTTTERSSLTTRLYLCGTQSVGLVDILSSRARDLGSESIGASVSGVTGSVVMVHTVFFDDTSWMEASRWHFELTSLSNFVEVLVGIALTAVVGSESSSAFVILTAVVVVGVEVVESANTCWMLTSGWKISLANFCDVIKVLSILTERCYQETTSTGVVRVTDCVGSVSTIIFSDTQWMLTVSRDLVHASFG